MSRWRLRIPGIKALALGAAVASALGYSLLLLGDPAVERLAHNPNGVVQNAGAVALLGASILFGVAYARRRRLAYLLLALAFFVGAGEEASWGQFALGYEPPEAIAELNAQDEVTVHNLTVLQNVRRAIGFDLLLAAFIAFALAFTVLVPTLAARSKAAHRALARRVPIVPALFGTLLIANLVAFALAGILAGGDQAHAVAEIAEAGLSILFLAIAADAARRTPEVELRRSHLVEPSDERGRAVTERRPDPTSEEVPETVPTR